jgi:transposase InsO family protein
MEESKVEQRLRFVTKVRQEGYTVAEACREFGISRPTGYKWLERYEEEGLEGLEDRSRAPETIPHKTDEEVEELICALRKQYPELGPKKLRAWLKREHPEADWPAASTVGAILERNGLTENREPSRRSPPRSDPLEEADGPNEIWSADFKGQFELGDGTTCYPLTVTDNSSRMVLGCRALGSTKGAPVQQYFERVFERWGLPRAIRTDNGAPFASTAPRGLSKLSAWWRALGIDHERTDPGEPQQNGRHERMHLTLKRHTARPAAETMAAQQESFDGFRRFFNQLRPHEALGQTPPRTVHTRSETDYPDELGVQEYPHCDLSRKIPDHGRISLACHKVFVTNALTGYRVGLTEIDPGVWVVSFAGEDIGLFESGETTISRLDVPETVKRSRL